MGVRGPRGEHPPRDNQILTVEPLGGEGGGNQKCLGGDALIQITPSSLIYILSFDPPNLENFFF